MQSAVAIESVSENGIKSNGEPLDDHQEEEEEEEEEDEASEDGDLDAEAEEMARRLESQLWEDIRRANAASSTAENGDSVPAPVDPANKEAAVLATMKTTLTILESDEQAKAALTAMAIPGNEGLDVLAAIKQAVETNHIPLSLAIPLSQCILALCQSEALFSGPPTLPTEVQTGKRKRDATEDAHSGQQNPAFKRVCVANYLSMTIQQSAKVITDTLGANPPTQPPSSALISPIQTHLHNIFLFAVTTSARGGTGNNVLQEICGLIQMLAVITGVQIGHTTQHNPSQSPYTHFPSADIATAVYPCLHCRKAFYRLNGLRAHQRVHGDDRPFHCDLCPATFARNHDLKRHLGLHGQKAWKCGGCSKIFSRKDAIKRHKKGSRERGEKGLPCIHAEEIEVAMSENDREREGRRHTFWSAKPATTAEPGAPPQGYDNSIEEDGEVPPSVMTEVQEIVESLHPILQQHALAGAAPGQITTDLDARGSQVTLASVIARAQAQLDVHTEGTAIQTPISSHSGPSLAAVGSAPPVQEDENGNAFRAEGNAETSGPVLSSYGLSDEQAMMLELAIANAASTALALAEAEAAMEEDENSDDEDEDMEANSEGGETAAGTQES